MIVTASVPDGGRFPAEWGFVLGFAVSAAAMAGVLAVAAAAPRRTGRNCDDRDRPSIAPITFTAPLPGSADATV
ncbi:hypothetical protein Acsp04_43570 [Actinomadura sp. NBRC 104425]|uniref:hypothetical protein n=1 Tax=Actinomadura sp. NBRC 104425 TaxID=3032204 RepID=UPI0024A5E110|nr:hypothetical protein [Actinomadura sp. NBRC 104425]GLZ14122.1 hypothetical protein Acsp04_43570 [Actinomadura sp. NBRC 104425]